MIISASRRTDLPACYADWLVNRLHVGYCMVKNPYNPAQIKRVSLLPEDVTSIVLWTKNAAPLLPHLAALCHTSTTFSTPSRPITRTLKQILQIKQA